jgi:hypothetical protein
MLRADEQAVVVLSAITEHADRLSGELAVVEPGRVRFRTENAG